ncbi:MAG: AAA family ATPase [Alphaproteobacteria bacterium]
MSGIFSFGHSSDQTMHGDFMSFVTDEESLASLRGWAERQGYPQATVQQGGPDMFAQMLESSAPPKMVIVDMDGQIDPVASTARLVSLCGGDCRLIVVGSANDVALYRRVLTAGAVDYLVKPLSPETLNQALAAALRGNVGGGKPDVKEARLITFIGARGGVGTTTIALNVGWFLAHEFNRTVTLFDLDLQFGTSSLSLDLEPGRGLRDIVSSPHRVDALMIASSTVPESDNFSILGAEEAIDEVVPIEGSAITALLKEMRNNFDFIIVDLPRHMFASHKRLLATSQEIVIVSDLTLAGIRDTLRIKSALVSLGSSARITIVASRTNASGAGHIDRAVFEKGMQGKIDASVAEDAATIATAANSGKALGATAPRATLTKSLRDLAMRLGNVDEMAVKKVSFLDKLIAGNKKKGKRDASGGGQGKK